MRKKFLRILSFVLSAALVITQLPPITVNAAGEITFGDPDGNGTYTQIFANGYPIIITAGSDASKSLIYLDVNSDSVVDADEVSVTLSECAGDAVNGYDLSEKTIFGGSELSGSTVASAQVTILGGKVLGIIGGGSAGNVTENATLRIGVDAVITGSASLTDQGTVGGGSSVQYETAFYNSTVKYSIPAPQWIVSGSTCARPADPEKSGLSFSGWTASDGSMYNFAALVNSPIKLYSNWVQPITIFTSSYSDTTLDIAVNGYSAILTSGADTSKTLLYIDSDSDGTIDAEEPVMTLTGFSGDTVNGYDLSGAAILGGTTAAGSTITDTRITMLAGTVKYIFGGGDSGDVSGTAKIDIYGGKITNIYGGGYSGSVGNTNIVFNNGNVTYIYGGGYSGNVSGNASISVAAGVVGEIYAGCYSGSTGSTSVSFAGGQVYKIFGGGYNGSVMNGTSVSVTGGRVIFDVYGGGRVGSVAGNTTVNVSGCYAQNVYGGGLTGNVSGSAVVSIGADATTTTAKTTASGTVGPGSYVQLEAAFYDGTTRLTTPASQWIVSGGTVSAPADLSKSGNIFLGWVLSDSSAYDFSAIVKTPKQLYACWDLESIPDTHISTHGLYISANGAPIIITAGLNSNTTLIYLDTDSDGVIDPGETAVSLEGFTGDAVNGYDLSSASIFGAGFMPGSVPVESTEIRMTGGKVKSVYGGGYYSDVSSNTSVTISGGSVTDYLQGGGYYGNVSGNASVLVNGGAVGFTFKCIYSGGFHGNVTGSATVNIGADSTQTADSGARESGTVGTGSCVRYEIAFYDGTIKYTDPVSQWVVSGSNPVRPTDPTKTGSTFVAWKLSDFTSFNFSSAVTKSVKVYASWGPISVFGFGGSPYIATNGYSIILTQGADTSKTLIYVDANSNEIIDAGEVPVALEGLTGDTTNGYDLSTAYIYGGGYGFGIVVPQTKITMLGGKVLQIVGGGYQGRVSGDTRVVIRGGAVSYIYGGSSQGIVSGNTYIELSGGTINFVYGESGIVSGTSYIYIKVGMVLRSGCVPYADSVQYEVKYIDGTAEYTTQWVVSGSSATAPVSPVNASKTFGKWVVDTDGMPYDFTKSVNSAFALYASWGPFTTFYLPLYYTYNIALNGYSVIIAAGADTSKTLIYIDTDSDGIIDEGEVPVSLDRFSGDTVNGYDLSGADVYGGGAISSDPVSNTKITMLSGAVRNIFGGGYYGSVNGNTHVSISGGSLNSLYGGGSIGSVSGNTNVTISGGTAESSVFGGGKEVGSDSGNTNVTITGGTVGFIYGGGGAGDVSGDAMTTLTGGLVDNSVYGGGYSGDVMGVATVRIGVDCSVNGTIYTFRQGGGTVGIGSDFQFEAAFYNGPVKYSVPASQWITDGSKAVEPTPPQDPDSILGFVKWQLNGTDYDFAEPVTEPIILSATWLPLPTLTLASGQSVLYSGAAAAYPSDKITNSGDSTAYSWSYSMDNGSTWKTGMPTSSGLYRIKVTSTVTDNYSAATSAAVSFTVISPAPTNPKAVSVSGSSVKLTWTAVSGATGYVIYRSASSASGFASIASATSASYTNTGLTTGTTYYYQIKAYTIVGATKIYSTATTAVSAKPIPAAPTGLKVASAGYSNCKLTWTEVSGASGYLIYRSTSSTSGFASIATSASASYTNTGLTTGTMYYYQIKAYTIVGTTKIYSTASATAGAKPIPAAPTGLKAVSAGYNICKLTWTAVTGATGYLIYRSTSSASGFASIAKATSTSYTNTGLTTGKTYYYQIKAFTTVGTTKICSAASATAGATPIPASPTGLTASRASAVSIKISWNAVTGATGYAMYRSTSSTSGFTYVKTVTSTSYTNIGLTTGTKYYYQIKAYTTVGTTKIYSTATAAVGAKP